MKMSFWCGGCKLDQDLEPFKNSNFLVPKGWFEAKCKKCRQKLIRHLTPKDDPYYFQSKRVKIERDKSRKDVIQYGETGFQTFYKSQWDEFEKQREDFEMEMARRKKEAEDYVHRMRSNVNETQLAKAVVKAEEKLSGYKYL